MKEQSPIRSDRDLQDALITYLADAGLRSAVGPLPLSPEQAQRAGKFARFLARRYYRDRLTRSFRYSRRFAQAAETIVDTPAFDSFLSDCVLGSLPSAERAGELAMDLLHQLPAPAPWWRDLLLYERAFFLQAATNENVIATPFPQPGRSAQCLNFSWNLPDLLLRLKSGDPITDELRHDVTLLFSRTRLGRIYVVEIDAATVAVFRAANGRRNPAQISEAASLPAVTVQQWLQALGQIGALVTSFEV